MARRTFGTIIQRYNGKFVGRYKHQDRYYYTPTVRTKAQARADLHDIQQAIRHGEWQPPTKKPKNPATTKTATLEQFANHWLEGLEKDQLSPNTLRSYQSSMRARILPTLGNIRVSDLTAKDINRLVKQLSETLAPASAQNTLRTLSTCLSVAVKKQIIDTNPVTRVEPLRGVKRQHQPIALTGEQLDLLIDEADEYFKAAYALAGWGGLRYGEIAALTRADIDLDAHTVTISKAVKRAPGGELVLGAPKSQAGYRTITLPERALSVVERHLETFTPPNKGALVFHRTNHAKHYLTDRVVRKNLQELCKRLGLPVMRFHDLRHTGLTLYGQAGATIADLMHRAGHADAKTVMIYQHSNLKRDAELANKMGF